MVGLCYQANKVFLSLMLFTLLMMVTVVSTAKSIKEPEIKTHSAELPRSVSNGSDVDIIPLGTAEYPGLCKYRGHIGKYQCINVKPQRHGDIQRTACKGKNLYLSKGKCYSCPGGYKRTNITRPMAGDPEACKERGVKLGRKDRVPATYVRKAYLGCPGGQFKYKGGCYTCPAKTKRKHFAGIDSGKCRVEKEYRCNNGLVLHKSAPKNIWESAGSWAGLKHKKYCGQPFDLNAYVVEAAATEANQLLIEAMVRFGIKMVRDDVETKRKVADFKEAIKDKRLKRAYNILKSFDEFQYVEQAALTGQQLSISVGLSYDQSLIAGYNHELGLAIDIGQRKLVSYRAHGLTKGASIGFDAGVNVGIWKGSFMTSYSQGYVVSAINGVGVWSDYYKPKRDDGLNQPHMTGITSSFGVGAGLELGEYNEVWTKVGEFLECDIESGFRLSC